MEELFRPVKTTRRFQDNITKFETLSLKEKTATQDSSTKSMVSIIDLSSEPSDVATDSLSIRPSTASSHSSVSTRPHYLKHKRHDTTAFTQKSYLGDTAPSTLPDDAREVLKSQPEIDDLSAVMQYLQYGIDGKHDFNIRIPGPKASQLVNVLVTITIPDQWLHFRDNTALSRNDTQIKRTLLACLTSVTGLGALLLQIKQLSASTARDKSTILEDTIAVLSLVLDGYNVLKRFIHDTDTLLATEIARRVSWQELTALLAGSRVFSTMSQVFTIIDIENRPDQHSWLGDGPAYSAWLSKNISNAAVSLGTVGTSNDLSLGMLTQMLKRGLGLGYRG
jgi:hypothetical protein